MILALKFQIRDKEWVINKIAIELNKCLGDRFNNYLTLHHYFTKIHRIRI